MSLFTCKRCGNPIRYSDSAPECGYCGFNPLMDQEPITAYYDEGYTGSCMEATLRHSVDMNKIPREPRTLRWSGRIDSAANLLLTASYFRYDFNIQGSFLYVFDRRQGGQIIEECWSPEIFGQILRNYIDQVDWEGSQK